MKIGKGSTVVKGAPNYRHIKVFSESDDSKCYYVTVNVNDGKIIGCSCPASAMRPFLKCKHQKEIINRRLLQI